MRVALDFGLRKLPRCLISLLGVLLTPVGKTGLGPFELMV